MKASILYVRFKGIPLWKRNLLLRRSGDRRSRHFVDKKEGVGVEELGTKKWSLTEFHEIWECWLWIISLQHIKKLEGCFSDFRWNLDTFLWQVSEKAYDRGETVSLSVRFLQIYETNYALFIYLRNVKITKARINCIIAIYHWNQHFHAINFLTKCAWKRRRQLERIFMRKP